MEFAANSEVYSETKDHRVFEKLLIDISAHFIDIPYPYINQAIEDAQRRICKSLKIDTAVLWQWADREKNLLTVTHHTLPPDAPEPDQNIDGSVSFPWAYNKLLQGEVLAYSNDDLPEEAHIDRVNRQHFGIVSSVAIPLGIGGNPIMGILTFDMLGKKRVWTDDEVNRLQLVADIFSNALSRKEYEKQLFESHEKVHLAADSAGAGFWEMDYNTGNVWCSKQTRKIFQLPSDKVLTVAHFQNAIHPDDWDEVAEAIDTAFKDGAKFKIEYRLKDATSTVRWVCSWGTPVFDAECRPIRLTGISLECTERKQLEEQLKAQNNELRSLKELVEQENVYLRSELKVDQGFANVIGKSDAFKKVLHDVENVASTPATVLLLGETGTGKGLIANLVHSLSERRDRSFITVNCAALPHNLIESELFGRAKGAFTGADARQPGRFEVANHGTIFLDEIGDLALEVQAKLLRVLQDSEFEQLGSARTSKVDVRVIAATGRDLKKEVAEGRFREDLYYRLNVFPITIPPLRERKDDIAALARYFVKKYNQKMGKNVQTIPKQLLGQMERYPWPGNVRELEHLIERSVILSAGQSLSMNKDILNIPSSSSSDTRATGLATIERDHIIDVLKQTRWKIEGPHGAAVLLDIHPSTLRFRMKKLNIKRPS